MAKTKAKDEHRRSTLVSSLTRPDEFHDAGEWDIEKRKIDTEDRGCKHVSNDISDGHHLNASNSIRVRLESWPPLTNIEAS